MAGIKEENSSERTMLMSGSVCLMKGMEELWLILENLGRVRPGCLGVPGSQDYRFCRFGNDMVCYQPGALALVYGSGQR